MEEEKEKEKEHNVSEAASLAESHHDDQLRDKQPDLLAAEPANNDAATIVYPGTAKRALILAAVSLATFLVALDITIISTAIPKITDQFHSLDDVAWYGTGFFITCAAFQSVYGKGYKYFSVKMVYLLAVFIFEVGSLICAVAPNSKALIVGRAIAGLGGAGLTSGGYILVGYSAPPAKTPALLGVVAGSFSVASVVGPLIGGAFTTNTTWRWCFYINLPIGSIAALFVLIFYQNPTHVKPPQATWKEKISQMDILGAIIILGAMICFLLAMQWGGLEKSWGSADVVGTLVGAAALLAVFVVLEIWLGERASVNKRLLKTRTLGLLAFYNVFVSGGFFVLLYNLPLYFQVVDGVSAAESGIRTIPTVAAVSIFAIVAGLVITATGDYQLPILFGAVLIAVGSGLIYTLDVGTGSGKYIGYQIVVGIGLGLCMQTAAIVAQGVVEPEDLSLATSTTLFLQLLSGSVWLAIAQSVFQNRLKLELQKDKSINPAQILAGGATELRTVLSGPDLTFGINSYMKGLKDAFVIDLALGCAAVVIVVIMIFFDRRRMGKGAVKDSVEEGLKE